MLVFTVTYNEMDGAYMTLGIPFHKHFNNLIKVTLN